MNPSSAWASEDLKAWVLSWNSHQFGCCMVMLFFAASCHLHDRTVDDDDDDDDVD